MDGTINVCNIVFTYCSTADANKVDSAVDPSLAITPNGVDFVVNASQNDIACNIGSTKIREMILYFLK